MFQGRLKGVSREISVSFKGISNKFPDSFKGISISGFQGCLKESEWVFEGVSKVFQGCFKKD